MKLLHCLFVVTTVSSYRATNNNKWDPYNQPPITRRNSGYSVYENGARDVPSLRLIQYQRIQEPIRYPNKIHNLKNIPLPKTDEKPVQELSKNDWIPIAPSVTVNQNSYQIQPEKHLLHYSKGEPTLKPSNREVTRPKNNVFQQPTITQPVRVGYNQPVRLPNRAYSSQNNGVPQIPQEQQQQSQQQEQYQRQDSPLTLFKVPQKKNIPNPVLRYQVQPHKNIYNNTPVRLAVKPASSQPNPQTQVEPQPVLDYLPKYSQTKQFQKPRHSQSVQETSHSAINKPEIIFNPFRSNNIASSTVLSAPSSKQVSPIFAKTNTQIDPESERQAFFKNFNIHQFLEQQKALRPEQTNPIPEAVRNKPSSNYFETFETAKQDYDPEDKKRDYSLLHKNYRDDKLHEPYSETENERDEEEPEVEREEDEKAPRVRQETPQDIPTKPIYPGEGKWAKPGFKHRPYIRQNPYDEIKDTSDKTPDGYDTFLKGEEFFNKNNVRFHSQLNQFPINHKLGQFLENDSSKKSSLNTDSKLLGESHAEETKNEENEEESDGEEEEHEEEDEEEFVPTKLYAQVRHSESEEHLPSDEAEEGRLKEVVRDSKIQTVYTEEGFEDIGYDHAGHEKHAESDEGYGEKERKVQKVDEKRVPQKTILRESSGYNDGNELISDDEIKADKAALGIPDDAHSAESQFEDVPGVNIVQSPQKKNKKKKKNNRMGKKNRNRKEFMSTKETKTMTTKDKDDGNTDVEITGEVKVIMQPNNSSKSKYYVKKLPTVHKTMKSEDSEEEIARVQEVTTEKSNNNNNAKRNDFYIEEIFPDKNTEKIITTPYTPPQIESLEIPVTTLPTTAIPKTSESPKNDSKELEQNEEILSKIKSKNRKKRFTNDFPELDVDKELISKITHEIDTPKPDLTFVKYPYYKKFKELGLHENSPLRYAEDLKNIPQKKEGNMAFYEQAESRVSCPEIASTVEPIPERVLNAEQQAESEEEEEEDDESEKQTDDHEDEEGHESQNREVHEHPKTPRLNGLGDAIDCMKAKYFGENPLDSPFFQEDTVGPVQPIFNFGSASTQEKSQSVLSQKVLGTIKGQSQLKPESNPNDQIVETNNPQAQRLVVEIPNHIKSDTTTNSVTQLTNNGENQNVYHHIKPTEATSLINPKNKIELRPNNIYDQIRLLDLLPEGTNETLNGIVEPPPQAEKLVIWGSTLLDSVRMPRKNKQDRDDEESDPQAAGLRRRQRIHMKPKQSMYPSFNGNKYIPVTSYPASDRFRPPPTTAVPSKSKTHSEVYYKNNINPKEQMNVFTDILNNIKTSSENNIEKFDKKEEHIIHKNKKQHSKFKTPQLKASATNNNADNIYAQDSYLQAYKNPDNDLDIYPSKPTTLKPSKVPQPTSYEVTEPSTQPTKSKDTNNKKRLIIYLPSTQDTISKLTTSTHKPHITKISSTTKAPLLNIVPTVRTITLVREMLPPKHPNHMPVYKRDNKISETNQEDDTVDKIVNKFLFIGMKPPPLQKVYGYNEFLNKYPHRKRKYHKRRPKRSTGRSYASVSRRRGTTEKEEIETTTTEANDDYVPHRSRNFYYDEKLGKIVYLNQNRKEEEEELEEEIPVEIHYEEATEGRRITKSTTPKQNPIFATATPPPQGQSYIDFVKKLKSASNYHEIPDPVSTEASQVVTTTLKPVSTEAPEFLSILKKLHSDSTYRIIEDPDEKKSRKKSTTTAAPLEEDSEDDEEEEDSYTKIKNSFGGNIHEIGDNFKIFDITEYIPKMKNYMPKTKVDTSRYKTIERVTQATTPAADEELSATTQKERSPPQTSPTSVDIGTVKETTFKIIMEETIASEEPEAVREESSAILFTSTTTPVSPTYAPSETTIKPQIIRSRGRRPTRTTITTAAPVSSTEPIRRNTRRRLARPRSRTTTEKYLDEAEDSSTKVLRRRSDIEEGESEEGKVGGVNINKVKNDEKELKNTQGLYNQFIRRRKIASNKNLLNHSNDSDTNQSPTFSNGDSPTKMNVEVFRKYDIKQRHGGNYRKLSNNTSRNGDKEIVADSLSKSSKVNKDVEIISEYDKSMKHGGNYRSEDDGGYASTDDQDKEDVVILSNDNVAIEKEGSEDQLVTKTDNKPVRISLWGDAHNKEEELSTQIPQVVPSKPKRFNGKITKKNSRKPVTRLTDIVPKPEMFYTDPNLPLAVNLLIDGDTLSSDETGKIVSSTENSQETVADNSDGRKSKIINNNSDKVNRSSTSASTRVNVSKTDLTTSDSTRDKISTTKKPVFIKDPSKRFYFYAPV